jgi:hypothetical protein
MQCINIRARDEGNKGANSATQRHIAERGVTSEESDHDVA